MRSLRNQHMTKDKDTLHRHVLGIFADSYELNYSNSLRVTVNVLALII